MQKSLKYVFPVLMTLMTSWQPAGVQLYFFVTGVTGAITATLLRQPSIRQLLRIRPTPTAESQKLYSKVIAGDIELSKLKGADGKVRYQAPTAPSPAPRTRTLASGINIKSGSRLPAHMARAADKEVKDEKPKSAWDQIKGIRSVPKMLGEKVSKWQDPRDPEVKKRQNAQDRQKRELHKYEEEKKRALRG